MSRPPIGIICSSPGWGGLEINTIRLVGWLREAGWEIHLLAAEGSPAFENAAGATDSVTVFGKNTGNFSRLKQLDRWVKQKGIRLLFVPFNKDLKLASLYKRFINRKIRLVYQQHMRVGIPKRDLIHTRRYAMIDKWIAPLEYLKDETLELTRIPAQKIRIIPFGIEPDHFLKTEITRQAAREKLSLPENAFIIGVLGRLDPKKGHDLVVRAVAALRSSGENIHALFMGSKTVNEGDEYVAGLHQLIRDNELQDYIHFRPYDPDVMQFFKAIDVFAMPSHGETFGMVTIEAMAAGVPVIGTDNFGTRELLGEGEYGWLFEKDDVSGFVALVQNIRSGKGISEKTRAAAEKVMSSYTRNGMTEQVSVLLDELV